MAAPPLRRETAADGAGWLTNDEEERAGIGFELGVGDAVLEGQHEPGINELALPTLRCRAWCERHFDPVIAICEVHRFHYRRKENARRAAVVTRVRPVAVKHTASG